jgi:hypothetical protein
MEFASDEPASVVVPAEADPNFSFETQAETAFQWLERRVIALENACHRHGIEVEKVEAS